MQNLPLMLPITSRNCLQLQEDTIVDNQIRAKSPYNLPAKIHWYRDFSSDAKPSLDKSDPQSLLLDTLQKSAAQLVIDLKKHS